MPLQIARFTCRFTNRIPLAKQPRFSLGSCKQESPVFYGETECKDRFKPVVCCPYRSSEAISTIDSAVLRPSRLSGNHIAAGREKGTEMADRQFAIYSADDESLTFYRYGRIPVVGTEFAGKHVTKVFENFNNHCWTTDAIADRVTGVSVADGGIKPRKLCHWFTRFENLRAADLEKLDTTYTTTAQGLFESCGNLEQVRMPRFGMPLVTDTSRMFYSCKSLKRLGMGGYDLYSAVDLHEMFFGCERLRKIGTETWNISRAVDLNRMFYGCMNLSEDLSSWTLENWRENARFSAGAPGVIDPDWDYAFTRQFSRCPM